MKNQNWFHSDGTVTGWQAIGRNLVAGLIYFIGYIAVFASLEKSPLLAIFLAIPFISMYIMIICCTWKRRMQAFGWKGGWLNLFFPNLTDATYPNKDK